jgi:hypothetical protein
VRKELECPFWDNDKQKCTKGAVPHLNNIWICKGADHNRCRTYNRAVRTKFTTNELISWKR